MDDAVKLLYLKHVYFIVSYIIIYYLRYILFLAAL